MGRGPCESVPGRVPPDSGCSTNANGSVADQSGDLCNGGAGNGASYDPIVPTIMGGNAPNARQPNLPKPGTNNQPQKPSDTQCKPWQLGPCKSDPTLRPVIKFACGSSIPEAVFKSVVGGALTGGAIGAYGGFVSGEILGGWVTFGTSGLAGAATGAVILGTFGASRGVFLGVARGLACQAAGAYSQ